MGNICETVDASAYAMEGNDKIRLRSNSYDNKNNTRRRSRETTITTQDSETRQNSCEKDKFLGNHHQTSFKS